MDTVTVSPKYRVVIPLAVREALGIRPWQRIQVMVYENRIECIPVRAAKQMRGFLKGIDTAVPRDDDRVGTSSTCRGGWNSSLMELPNVKFRRKGNS